MRDLTTDPIDAPCSRHVSRDSDACVRRPDSFQETPTLCVRSMFEDIDLTAGASDLVTEIGRISGGRCHALGC